MHQLQLNNLTLNHAWTSGTAVQCLSNRALSRVYIASPKHEEGWETRDSYANPRRSREFA